MKQVLRFLRSLSRHNDRAWFEAHRADYLKARATVDSLAERLIGGIRSFDDTIGPLTVSDCTYRIYRDVRFSKDKSPYKTHMGVFVNRGGKKSGYGGYYRRRGARSRPRHGRRPEEGPEGLPGGQPGRGAVQVEEFLPPAGTG